MDEQTLLLVAGGIAVFYFLSQQTKTDDEGRLKDESVNVESALEILKEFKPKLDDKSKAGFTEASVQKQLHDFLKKKIVYVVREQGIEDLNALKIDFDLGRGKVGIEVKLANQLFKSANLHRLIGQLKEYTRNKYDEKNLIVMVIGTEEDKTERAYLSKIQQEVEDIEATYLFKTIK